MSGRILGGPIALLGVIASTLATTSLPAFSEPRAVLELFTSQGCSSCPAADKLVGELSKDPQVIALSLAIDYWDYLGWKDTLAIPGHGGRQRAYSRARGDRDVFTPQMVVNGSAQALGSDKAAIERAIVQSRRNAAVLALPVTMTIADGKLTVSAPAGKIGSERAEVWLCPMTKAVPVEINRGENKGRTVTYHNVVRQWIKLGDWQGAAATWSVPLKDVKIGGVDQVAVVVQSGAASAPGPMYGAAMAALP
jgi:hypothetical protein